MYLLQFFMLMTLNKIKKNHAALKIGFCNKWWLTNILSNIRLYRMTSCDLNWLFIRVETIFTFQVMQQDKSKFLFEFENFLIQFIQPDGEIEFSLKIELYLECLILNSIINELYSLFQGRQNEFLDTWQPFYNS